MADWAHAAEVQRELHHWLESDPGRAWSKWWLEGESRGDPRKGQMYGVLHQAEPYKLFTAAPIWVSHEMCDVVDAAREGFRPEPIEAEDFIVPTGFLYFARPIYLLDRNGLQVSVGAISWAPTRWSEARGTEMFASPEHPEMGGMTNTDLGDESGLWGMSVTLYSSTKAKEDSFAAKHAEFVREFGGTELVPLHYTAIEYGDVLDEGHLQDEDGNYTGADQWWQLVQTTLRLMQQRLSIRSDERLPRPFRRRFERANYPVPEVVVIRLRRPAARHHSDEEGGTVEWTHRWIVDGFWRNHYFPSLGKHKRIWISPHVKGPEDLPLVVKRRHYKWDR